MPRARFSWRSTWKASEGSWQQSRIGWNGMGTDLVLPVSAALCRRKAEQPRLPVPEQLQRSPPGRARRVPGSPAASTKKAQFRGLPAWILGLYW